MAKRVQSTHATAARIKLAYRTALGQLYQGDSLIWLRSLPADSADLVFADPPFNLRKNYGPGVSDDLMNHKYLEWSFAWIDECARVLRQGGSTNALQLAEMVHRIRRTP